MIEECFALGNAFAHDTLRKCRYTHSHVAKTVDHSSVFMARLRPEIAYSCAMAVIWRWRCQS